MTEICFDRKLRGQAVVAAALELSMDKYILILEVRFRSLTLFAFFPHDLDLFSLSLSSFLSLALSSGCRFYVRSRFCYFKFGVLIHRTGAFVQHANTHTHTHIHTKLYTRITRGVASFLIFPSVRLVAADDGVFFVLSDGLSHRSHSRTHKFTIIYSAVYSHCGKLILTFLPLTHTHAHTCTHMHKHSFTHALTPSFTPNPALYDINF